MWKINTWKRICDRIDDTLDMVIWGYVYPTVKLLIIAAGWIAVVVIILKFLAWLVLGVPIIDGG